MVLGYDPLHWLSLINNHWSLYEYQAFAACHVLKAIVSGVETCSVHNFKQPYLFSNSALQCLDYSLTWILCYIHIVIAVTGYQTLLFVCLFVSVFVFCTYFSIQSNISCFLCLIVSYSKRPKSSFVFLRKDLPMYQVQFRCKLSVFPSPVTWDHDLIEFVHFYSVHTPIPTWDISLRI